MTDTAAKESCSSALDDPRFEAPVNVLGLRGGMRKAEKASVVKFGKEGELLLWRVSTSWIRYISQTEDPETHRASCHSCQHMVS
jgi:hypothetical protein